MILSFWSDIEYVDDASNRFQFCVVTDGNNVGIFYAYRTSNFGNVDATVSYDGTNVNVGNGMDIQTGNFKAPVAGVYSFEFHGHICGTGGRVCLKLNGETKTTAYADRTSWIPLSCSVTLKLKTGDRVFILLKEGYLHDTPSEMLTHFSGRL